MSEGIKAMTGAVKAMLMSGVLREIDYYITEAMLRTHGLDEAPEDMVLAVALASRAVGEGHVCLDLDRVCPEWLRSLQPAGAGSQTPDPDVDRVLQAESDRLCARIRDPRRRCAWGLGAMPLIREGHRLYLRRFYDYECFTATRLMEMAQADGASALSPGMQARLEAMLPPGVQQAAARCALTRRLTLIIGGPGTGKTYTAARIIALLAHLPDDGGRPLRIRLAAPTGKAAARLGESIRQARAAIGPALFPDAAVLPEACTLDRLLGSIQGSPYFRHRRDNPLDADVVMVDEASMIDLAKMAKLLDALASGTRLVLLGDRYQLAAVAPGSVMAEICGGLALTGAAVELTESRRFRPDGAIARFSAAVNAGDSEVAAATLFDNPQNETYGANETDHAIRVVEIPATLDDRRSGVNPAFAQCVLSGYRALLAAQTPGEAFAALAQFRVLCALRQGPLGAEQVNTIIARVLSGCDRHAPGSEAEHDLLPRHRLEPVGDAYSHRVLMVTRNDRTTGLFNGDVGVVLPDPDDAGQLKVFFEKNRSDGEKDRFRSVSLHLLPAHETAFAMTVHKSQGSEFDRVLVLLPETDSPVFTRELIYTAVTRTRGGAEIWAERKTFERAVQRPVRRFTGLGDRLLIHP